MKILAKAELNAYSIFCELLDDQIIIEKIDIKYNKRIAIEYIIHVNKVLFILLCLYIILFINIIISTHGVKVDMNEVSIP